LLAQGEMVPGRGTAQSDTVSPPALVGESAGAAAAELASVGTP